MPSRRKTKRKGRRRRQRGGGLLDSYVKALVNVAVPLQLNMGARLRGKKGKEYRAMRSRYRTYLKNAK